MIYKEKYVYITAVIKFQIYAPNILSNLMLNYSQFYFFPAIVEY